MFRREWLKVIVLILLPINAWLGVFYYLHWQRQKALWEVLQPVPQEATVVVRHFQERHDFKVGRRLPYPFPYPTRLIGNPPSVGQGYPVLFVNISWIAAHEVWEPALTEALNASPYLQVVLLYRNEGVVDWKPITEMIQKLNSPRLSVLVGGGWMRSMFGTELNGTLLILCDGQGIIRSIEPYPELKISPYWEEEVKDWRPKLHQAVKKGLDKFFPKRAPQGGT